MKKIIIILTIILTSGIALFFYHQHINKKNINLIQKEIIKTTFPTDTNQNNQPNKVPNKAIDVEQKIVDEIKQNIDDWQKTNDLTSLSNALSLTYTGMDVESSYEPWISILLTKRLVKTIDSSSSKEYKQIIYYIYDWFINLSGEYEKLPQEQRQILSTDFMQAQLYINNI